MPGLISSAKNHEDRSRRIERLSQLIDSATDRIRRPMDVARQMKNISLRKSDLRVLLWEVLQEFHLQQFNSCIDINLQVPQGNFVFIDEELTREAFHNIIHNAIKAMPAGGTLNINSATSLNRETLKVIFADSGVGMSKEEVEAAKTGFVSTKSNTGLGVLVSSLLLRAQDGALEIESDRGVGTKVIATLPYYQMEESP
jgi:signal transduction histidine kinase